MRKTAMKAVTLALALGLQFAAVETSWAVNEPIYGSQLMNRQERMEHRRMMRSLKTQEERDAYRLEHHQKMQQRAQERGMQLPDAPPQQGMGMGGMGSMGPRGGR